MKKHLYFILLTLFIAQMPSESMGMVPKRSRLEISGNDEISIEGEQASKRRADEIIPIAPVTQYPDFAATQFETEIMPDSDVDTKSDNYTTDDDYPDTEQLNDKTLKNLTLDEWRNRPMISEDFIYLSSKYLKNMRKLYTNSPWLYDRCPKDQIIRVSQNDIYDEEKEAEDEPCMPCVVKLVMLQDTHTAIIGDIHGEYDTIESLFLSLNKRGFINDFLYIPDNSRIIFLGDYTDRGGFSMEILRAMLILAVKNPGKAFLLKGNHEDIYSNIDDGILKEIEKFETDKETQDNLIQNLVKIYEFTPVGMLLGFTGQEQTPFYFLAHGGPDIRYDYTDFLNLHKEALVNNGGLCFWNLTEDDLFKTPKSKLMLNSIQYRIRRNKEVALDLNLHISKRLDHGFLWNDIDLAPYETILPIYQSIGRGEGCISLDLGFIQEFLESFTNPYAKIVGLIRGHQHRIAKQVGMINNAEQLSPSCCCFVPMVKRNPILTTGVPIAINNTFSTTTVISGPIMEKNQMVNYLPTFLDLQFMGNNTWRFEAIEYQD